MVLHFKFLMLHFIGFINNPNDPDYVDISKDQKLLNVSFYYLIIQFVVSAFILWYPVEIAEKLGFYNRLEEIDYKTGVATIVISAVILAPLIEEGIFRLSLGYYREKSYFKWLYYLSALIFGWIHFFNYQFDNSHYLFIPFITMTQTFGGLMLGYIRIIYGFWYGVLLHSLFNILGVIWQFTIGFDL